MIVINAQGAIVGRLAAQVAKHLMAGEEVAVVEVQDAVLSGTLRAATERMNARRVQKDKRDPEKSPKFPRVPHMMFKRVVRGMLPKKSQRGRDALHNLKAYSGTPAELASQVVAASADIRKTDLAKKTTLGKLCGAFGYTPAQ